MNFKELALVLGLLAPTTALAQDAKEPPKAAEKLDVIVEKGISFHMPFHTAANHGMALSIIEKVQKEMQAQADKIGSKVRIDFSTEEIMWYAETHLNTDGYNGVTVGEVLEEKAKDEKYKDLIAKNVSSASMELQTPRFAYEDSESQDKLNDLLAEKAKEDKVDNSALYRKMMKVKIAKANGAKKVKTEEGEAVYLTKEMIANFEKDRARFVLPGGQIVADLPEGPKVGPEPDNAYIVDLTINFESPVVKAFAFKYIDVKAAYNQLTKQPVPKTAEDSLYILSQIAGEDNAVSGSKLEAKINGLKGKIAELRAKDDKEYSELDWGDVSVDSVTTAAGYIKISMAPEDKKQMKEAAEKYSLTLAQQLVWLRNNCSTYDAAKKESSMTKEQVASAIIALDEQYKKEDKK